MSKETIGDDGTVHAADIFETDIPYVYEFYLNKSGLVTWVLCILKYTAHFINIILLMVSFLRPRSRSRRFLDFGILKSINQDQNVKFVKCFGILSSKIHKLWISRSPILEPTFQNFKKSIFLIFWNNLKELFEVLGP